MNEIAQFEFNGKKLYDDYDFIITFRWATIKQ